MLFTKNQTRPETESRKDKDKDKDKKDMTTLTSWLMPKQT